MVEDVSTGFLGVPGVRIPRILNVKRQSDKVVGSYPRLYIDRLAHWRSLLVDLILKFEPLALVSQGNFAIAINLITQPIESRNLLICNE